MHLLKYFKAMSLRPENAKEIRALILELAIRGRLTEEWRRENPDVEPASVLLERIRVDKARLVKEKVIRKEKTLPDLPNVLPFKIPDNWNWTWLQNLGVIGSSKRVHKKEWQSDGIPFYRAREIVKLSKHGFVENDLYITPDHYNRLKNEGLFPERNDVMITGVGTIGVPYVVKEQDEFYFKDASVLVFKNVSKVFAPFLELLFSSPQWIESIHKESMGTTVHTLTISRANQTLIPIPPPSEQKAIVATVNRLLAEVDELEQQTTRFQALRQDYVTASLRALTGEDSGEAWAELRPHFQSFFNQDNGVKKLREAILELAVQGKLTKRWRAENPDVEPAGVLLERIEVEKARLVRDGSIKKIKKSPPIEANETSFLLPKSWKWCRLADTTEVITKGSSPKWQGVSYVNEGEGILFVTSENVGNFELLWKRKKYVEEKFNQIEPRSILKKGDILMNIVGASIGRTAVFNLDDVANINQAVTIIRLIEKASIEYFLLFLNSPTCISYMYDKQVDNARPNLSMGNISKFLIPLPPISEQIAIVKTVEALMAYCDQLQERITQREEAGEDFLRASVRELLLATESKEV